MIIGDRMISTTIKSLENRVITRPIGFESKNKTNVRKTLLTIELCKFVAPEIMKEKITIALTNENNMYATTIMAKTVGYNDFYCSSKSAAVHSPSQYETTSCKNDTVKQTKVIRR